METTHKCSETVAILDAGSQYSKVIDRRVRELYLSIIAIQSIWLTTEMCPPTYYHLILPWKS